MFSSHPIVRRWFSGIVAALLFSAAPVTSALADTVSYYLDQSNVVSALPDKTDYLKVTITSISAGAAMFDVTPVYAFNKAPVFGLQSFGFNYAVPNSLSASSFSALPSGWNVSFSAAQDGFGKYGAVLSTTGSGRMSSLDFTVTGLDGATPAQTLANFATLSTGGGSQGNQYFAAHLTGFTAGSTTSAYFAGTTVAQAPEPETFGMLLGGFAILAFTTRRRKTDQS